MTVSSIFNFAGSCRRLENEHRCHSLFLCLKAENEDCINFPEKNTPQEGSLVYERI